MPQIIIGDIEDHTHRLNTTKIHEIVEQWVLAHGGASTYGTLSTVYAAPAMEPELMTEAARAWNDAEGEPEDFQQEVEGKLYWFGFRYAP